MTNAVAKLWGQRWEADRRFISFEDENVKYAFTLQKITRRKMAKSTSRIKLTWKVVLLES